MPISKTELLAGITYVNLFDKIDKILTEKYKTSKSYCLTIYLDEIDSSLEHYSYSNKSKEIVDNIVNTYNKIGYMVEFKTSFDWGDKPYFTFNL